MPLPLVFIGGGIGPSTNDARDRMRLFEEGRAATWLLEAGVGASRHLSIGVEYSQPSPATAVTIGKFGSIAGRQEEKLLLGLLRARLAAQRRWALDLVGGAGILHQHHASGGCEAASVLCTDTSDAFLNERAPAFAVGLDVPIRVARHFEVAALARAYWLRRGEHTSESDVNLSWQYEWRSSTRMMVAISGRVVW